MNKLILFAKSFILIALISCNSYEQKKEILTKYVWVQSDGANFELGYDLITFDTSDINDTLGLVLDSSFAVRQGTRMIGKLSKISNSECTITASDGKEMVLNSLRKR